MEAVPPPAGAPDAFKGGPLVNARRLLGPYYGAVRRPSLIPVGLVVTISVAGAGCAAETSFDSSESAARIRAIQRAAATEDKAAIPKLIGLLDSDDPAVRMLSIRTLERMTGQTHGYDYAAPEWQRRPAVEVWRDWYTDGSTKTGTTAAVLGGGTGAIGSP
jgi:hypothetical protein